METITDLGKAAYLVACGLAVECIEYRPAEDRVGFRFPRAEAQCHGEAYEAGAAVPALEYYRALQGIRAMVRSTMRPHLEGRKKRG